MTARLTRRAFFALPVALPVAAVAAKVAPVKPFATGGVVGPARFTRIIDGCEIAVRRYSLTPPGTFLVRAPIEFGQQAFDIARLVNGKFDMTPREGAADAAKPVTAQAAAPVGDTTSRSLEADASDSVAPRQMAEPVVPTGNEGTSGERDTLAQPVAA